MSFEMDDSARNHPAVVDERPSTLPLSRAFPCLLDDGEVCVD